MEMIPANRLQKLPPYLFADLRRKIAEKRRLGVKVITLGIGDPDYPTPDPVLRELVRAIADPNDGDRHRYGCDAPVADLSRAIRDFYRRRYGVSLSDDQIAVTSGSKDAIVQFCLGILNPGDLGIAPQPGYPTYNIGHVFCSGQTHYVPLRRGNGWLVDFKEIPEDVAREAKLLWINYPNNPTTAVATPDFFKEAVEFGRKHNILICHDSAYAENTYDGYKAPSILQVPGAEDTAVEFYSLSKGFNMTGWRVGCVVGNTPAVKALKLVKDNIDNGMLRAIQFAAVKALDSMESIVPAINSVYQRRRDMVVSALEQAGWPVEKPKATIYVWAPTPEQYNGSSAAFAEDLLEKAGLVVTPGRGYGVTGDGYYRISLTYPDEVIKEALDRIMTVAGKK
ncbi:MAG: aminotransferase class I/II-fold pyridoxal phosphate-dependent enzyme [Planctomycetota bacterium]|jgi:LL-diaminopimelate aminotransferase|nr:aminotransferase class I/II-fold pyridoxal phosphate-dependent enzyme [Planctomycetota bacterium]